MNDLQANVSNDCLRFLGVSLSGNKSAKTSLAVLEYYQSADRWVLAHIFDKISTQDDLSSDEILHRYIEQSPRVQSIHIDAPLVLPKCMRCQLPCPGHDACEEEEILWMHKFYKKESKSKKPKKVLSPYTERVSELYWRYHLNEKFVLDHAGGSNKAPLMLRAMYLRRRLDARFKVFEFYPEVSLWQIGRAYRLNKSTLRSYSHAANGKESRELILNHLQKKINFFAYDVELKKMTKGLNAFEAFLGALTGAYLYKNLIFQRDKKIPKSEPWVNVPQENQL